MKIDKEYYLIIDLESTCSNNHSVPRHEMEIIEIGAVMLNAKTFEIYSEFQSFIKPVRHPILTEFCIDLTNIKQEDVENSPIFSDVINKMNEWMLPFDYIFCSWGNYDKKQFIQDCEHHNIPYPFGTEHLNLKEAFAKYAGVKPGGISKALQYFGLEFNGALHRGIDDAKNIARVVQTFFGRIDIPQKQIIYCREKPVSKENEDIDKIIADAKVGLEKSIKLLCELSVQLSNIRKKYE